MGKGGGCVPSKRRPCRSPTMLRRTQRRLEGGTDPGPGGRRADETELPAQEATSSSSPPLSGGAKLKIFIVFYSMYGHVEGLARRLKRGVDGVEGVEGVLYRVPETLPVEVLNQMRAPPKDDTIPEITAAELAAADGCCSGFRRGTGRWRRK
ncbi:NAD(P)H dehydrogenase (quinone) FQR 2 [Spatholobus suberectus]|nr:NAD(P)H dehydrogenase (quinone) FQR 2 [Spatholobus suberectus]